jgi:signal transduction histidine kinase
MPSIRAKLWVGAGGLLLILTAVTILCLAVLTHYSGALRRTFRENYGSVVYCDEMKAALDRLNEDAMSRAFSSPASGAHAGGIDAASERERFEVNLRGQINNAFLPAEPERSRHIRELWSVYASHYDAFDEADGRGALADAYRADLLPQYVLVRDAIQRVSDMNLAHMRRVDDGVTRTMLTVRRALVVLLAGAAGFAILFLAAVGRWIVEPVRSLTRTAHAIAQGNLDDRVPVRARDELGTLAAAFNQMAERLGEFRRLDLERLVRTQQSTQMAIDSLPDAVVVFDELGRIEIANERARSGFGLAPSPDGAAVPTWLADLARQVQETQRAVEPTGYAGALQRFEGGKERFYIPHAVPIRPGGSRAVVGVTVVLADVTALKAVDEAKSDLVSTVSHELKTPLTGIRMATHLLSEPVFGDLTAKQQEILRAARDNAERLTQIIEGLLSVRRIEHAGRGAANAGIHLEPTPVRYVIDVAVDHHRDTFRRRQIELTLSIPDGLPDVRADRPTVAHALGNLLSNAARYTPPGGKVTVAARSLCSDAAGPPTEVEFSVSDTGPGIPADGVDRLFEKFYRLAAPDAGESHPSGAGLGLAIARDIVAAHGGRISATNCDAGGAVFCFTLRVHVNDMAPA